MTTVASGNESQRHTTERFLAHVDGGSRGNPGAAAWAVAVVDEDGRMVEGEAAGIGTATNNVAEYHALIAALEMAASRDVDEVEVRADSELIVRQMNGIYRVRHPDLIPLHARAATLARRFRAFRIVHVPRAKNRDADRLVNRALDLQDRDPGAPVRIREVPQSTEV